MKSAFTDILSKVGKEFVAHRPEILTGVGIGGMLVAIVTAVKATPKAMALLEEEKEKSEEPLKKTQVIKTVWKCYIPTVLSAGAGAACIIFAQTERAKENAALAAAYTLTESTFRDYQAKVAQNVSRKKENEIRADVAEEQLQKHPVKESEIIITGKGDVLCYESTTGRYFKHDIEKLRKIENEVNLKLRNEDYITLNEVYSEIGLDNVDVGKYLGWNIDKGYIEFRFSSILASNGVPCLVLSFTVPPYYYYNK